MPTDQVQTVFSPQITQSTNWFQMHPYIGWSLFIIVLVFAGLIALVKSLPIFDTFLASVIKPFLRYWKFKRLEKAAKKYDIRGHVNIAVRDLGRQLPKGWIREVDIKWVENESKEDLFYDNEIVVRVRPYAEQSKNFVNVAYQYLNKALFPRVRKVIPDIQREAAILYFCGRIARKRDDATYDVFVSEIFEPAVDRKAKVVDYHERYKTLDQKGLFSGAFLREIHHIAEEVRTDPRRRQMATELNDVLKHLEEFSKKYDESVSERTPKIDEHLWSRNSAVSTYGLLLVGHPIVVESKGVRPYVGRAQRRFDEKVERLYVIGASRDNGFADQVVDAISQQTGYVLGEKFELYNDYRGSPGGVAAIFTLP